MWEEASVELKQLTDLTKLVAKMQLESIQAKHDAEILCLRGHHAKWERQLVYVGIKNINSHRDDNGNFHRIWNSPIWIYQEGKPRNSIIFLKSKQRDNQKIII